ncbi:MAG: hypothetical protein AAGJ82_07835 [Bacteroidota bacterium]
MQKVRDWLDQNTKGMALAGVLLALGGILLDFSKLKQSEYQDTIEESKNELTRLREVEQKCYHDFVNLNRQISDFQNKIIMLETATMDSPLPMWLKSIGTVSKPGVMLVLNNAYEQRFLQPIGKRAIDYIGRTDAEFWGDTLGRRYWSLDMEVIRTRSKVDQYEFDPLTGDKLRVIKYPRLYNNNVIGIGGMAIPDMTTKN